MSKTAAAALAFLGLLLFSIPMSAQFNGLLPSGNVYGGVSYAQLTNVTNQQSYKGWNASFEALPFVRFPHVGVVVEGSGLYRRGETVPAGNDRQRHRQDHADRLHDVSAPGRGRRNDARSPDPAFTAAQYDRLALLYVIASVRAERWLIPAFHAAIDAQIANGHDDPLNFDVDSFARSLEGVIAKLGTLDQVEASH